MKLRDWIEAGWVLVLILFLSSVMFYLMDQATSSGCK